MGLRGSQHTAAASRPVPRLSAPSAPDCASNPSFTLQDANKPFLGARNLNQQVSGTPVRDCWDSSSVSPGPSQWGGGAWGAQHGKWKEDLLSLPQGYLQPRVHLQCLRHGKPPAHRRQQKTLRAAGLPHAGLFWVSVSRQTGGGPCHTQSGTRRGAGCGGLPLSLEHSCGRWGWQRPQPEWVKQCWPPQLEVLPEGWEQWGSGCCDGSGVEWPRIGSSQCNPPSQG